MNCGDAGVSMYANEPVCVRSESGTTATDQKMICKISGCPEDKIDAEAFSVEDKAVRLFSVRVKQPYALYKLCMKVTAKDVLNELSATAPVQFALIRDDSDKTVRTLATAYGALGDREVANIAVDGAEVYDGSYNVIGFPNTPGGQLQALQWNVTGWIERLRNSY
jgi:hypothetical protein